MSRYCELCGEDVKTAICVGCGRRMCNHCHDLDDVNSCIECAEMYINDPLFSDDDSKERLDDDDLDGLDEEGVLDEDDLLAMISNSGGSIRPTGIY